jgi:hypothetical protein
VVLVYAFKIFIVKNIHENKTHIGGVMVRMLLSEDRGFELRSGQSREYKIGIGCFSAKHTTLKGNGKYLLSRNQDNMSEWSDMSTHKSVVSVCYHYKNPTPCWSCTNRISSSHRM